MIKRIYIHNYKCFENFEFLPDGKTPLMVIGKNGTGKSTLVEVIKFLQGLVVPVTASVSLSPEKIPNINSPIRFELEVEAEGHSFEFRVVFQYEKETRTFIVAEEYLYYNNELIIAREKEKIETIRNQVKSTYTIDQHVIALQTMPNFPSTEDPLSIFRHLMQLMLILKPVPSQMRADYVNRQLPMRPPNIPDWFVDPTCLEFVPWLQVQLAMIPELYPKMKLVLTEFLPDLKSFQFERIIAGQYRLNVVFHLTRASEQYVHQASEKTIVFDELSDGEKCFFIAAAIRALNAVAPRPLTCIWDEPDNYLSIKEVNAFMSSLCADFYAKGQIIFFSHNEDAIRAFTKDEILIFRRRTHLDPVLNPITMEEFLKKSPEGWTLSEALQSEEVWS